MSAEVEVAPLSHPQQRLLLAEQLMPGAAEHVLISAYQLRGPLRVGALRQAMLDVASRHPALRTVYGWDDDLTPVQRVTAAPPDDLLEERPLATDPTLPPDQLAASVYADWWDEPFDLEQRPPLRARLVRLAADRHLLCYAVHHIAFDEWSAQVFAADLRFAYAARLGGRAPNWAPAPSYLDYLRREAAQLAAVQPRDIDFWRRTLRELPAPILPAPAEPEGPVGEHTVALPAEVVRGFTERCGRLGRLPLGILLCAAAQALGDEYATRQLSLGTLFSGRVQAEYRSVIGCFVNPVVIPVDLSVGSTFLDRLGPVTRTVLNCLTHARTPYDEVVRELRAPERPLPWYQALAFLFDQPRGGQPAGGDLEFQRLRVCPPRTSLDLAIEGVPRHDGGWWLRGRWRTDLVPGPTGHRIISELATSLHRLAR